MTKDIEKEKDYNEWIADRVSSDGTVKTYVSAVNMYDKWRKDRDITEKLLTDYFMMQRKTKTKYYVLYALKSYIRYLDIENINWYVIQKDTQWSKHIKKNIPERNLTFEEVRLLAKALEYPYRDILILQFEFGSRIREILNMDKKVLTIGSIFSKDDSIKAVLFGKGDKSRTVFSFTPVAKKILMPHLKKEGKLFPREIFRKNEQKTDDKEQLIRSIYHKVNDKIQEQALKTLKKQLSTHWFRHARILDLYEKGHDPRTIMRFTGHTSLDMLMKYLISAGLDTKLLVQKEIESGKNIDWE